MWLLITALGTALASYIGNDIVDIYQAKAENKQPMGPRFFDRFNAVGFIWKFLAVAGVIGTTLFFFISRTRRRRLF